jgi:CheY-like chemotaxis protein
MDGLEATAAICAQEQATGDHLPMIALTAHALHNIREKCVATSMDGSLSKAAELAEMSAQALGSVDRSSEHARQEVAMAQQNISPLLHVWTGASRLCKAVEPTGGVALIRRPA